MVDIGNGGVDGAVVMGEGGVSEGKVGKVSFSFPWASFIAPLTFSPICFFASSFCLVLFFIPSCNVFPIC